MLPVKIFKKIMFILLLLLILTIITNLITAANYIRISKKISAKSIPYEQKKEKPSLKVLFIGDSTAVGTGAQEPGESVAGRLGHDHPGIEIKNLAKNGDKIEDLIPKLENLTDEKYDLIIIQAGGNNILQFTDTRKFEKDMSQVLDLAKNIGANVVLITTGNVGIAPFFPRPIGYFYTKRTQTVREIALRLTKEKNVIYVDLFRAEGDDPFVQDPERYHAKDLLHPSGDGYGIWYDKLTAALAKNSIKIPK